MSDMYSKWNKSNECVICVWLWSCPCVMTEIFESLLSSARVFSCFESWACYRLFSIRYSNFFFFCDLFPTREPVVFPYFSRFSVSFKIKIIDSIIIILGSFFFDRFLYLLKWEILVFFCWFRKINKNTFSYSCQQILKEFLKKKKN